MEKKKATTLKKSNSKEVFQTDKLMDALLTLQEYMERAMMPFIVLGDVASQLRGYSDIQLEAGGIEVCIKPKDMHESYISILHTVLPQNTLWEDGKITYKHGEVPVTIKVVKKRYKCLEHPDSTFYMTSEFLLPNPFHAYEKVKGFI